MKKIDPKPVVVGCNSILDREGNWPNFHDAEVIDLKLWRGDVRPDEDIYVGPTITAQMVLCALQHPMLVTLKFENCCHLHLRNFGIQNPIMDLEFGQEARGCLKDGQPLSPYLLVHFQPALDFEMSFKCFRAVVLDSKRAT